MILTDHQGELEIAAQEVQPETSPSPGDFCAMVRVSTPNFSGVNPRVWIAADRFDSFLDALRAMERARRGEACLASMSPDSLSLRIKIRDSIGHVTASGWVGQTTRGGAGDSVTARIGFNLDLDPTLLPHVVEEFAALPRDADRRPGES